MDDRTVADAVCRALHGQGTDIVFGHPGGAILPIYDALYRFEPIRHVLTRHEQGAAHAADGFARATGRVGVCMATSGPGATNLVTGLATAMMDSVPVVAVTGQVPRKAMGTQAFQETDVVGLTMPVTKHGFLLTDPGEVQDVIGEAFHLAASGRPGPVLVDIPKDVQLAACDDARPRPTADHEGWSAGRGRDASPQGIERPPSEGTPSSADFERAATLVNEAERPVIMAGRGIVLSRTSSEMRELAERADIPVATTLLGLEALSPSHPLSLGLPGMHGTERANQAIQAADVILGLGLRFDDRVTGPRDSFAPTGSVIHMDVDPAAPGRRIQPAVTLVGDLHTTLPALARRVRPARRPRWRGRLDDWERDPGRADAPSPTPESMTGRTAIRALARRVADDSAIVVTDVGQHQMWMAQEMLDAVPGSHLTSGGLGTMGYALPAAMGAAVGRPDRSVWVVAGDGGFQMTLQELATVVQEDLPLRIAIMNNGFLGMVRQWQEIFYEGRFSATALSGPDVVLLARAYGIPARRIERYEDLAGGLEWADGRDGPVVLDLVIPPSEHVYPMVPSGAAIDEMMTGASKATVP